MLKLICQASVPRDVFPPTPPGPEGSNGNGLLRVQWAAGVWLLVLQTAIWPRPSTGPPNPLRTFRCYVDARHLRFRKPEPLVHLRFCRLLHAGFDLRFFARRMALRRGRSRLVYSCSAALVSGRGHPLTRF